MELLILVDGAAVSHVVRDSNMRLDYEALGDRIAEEVGVDEWRMRYYHGQLAEGNSRGVSRFLEMLEENDRIEVVRVPGKVLHLKCKECRELVVYEYLNVAERIIDDLLIGTHVQQFDKAVIVSGRDRFLPSVLLTDSIEDTAVYMAFWSDSKYLQFAHVQCQFIDLEKTEGLEAVQSPLAQEKARAALG